MNKNKCAQTLMDKAEFIHKTSSELDWLFSGLTVEAITVQTKIGWIIKTANEIKDLIEKRKHAGIVALDNRVKKGELCIKE